MAYFYTTELSLTLNDISCLWLELSFHRWPNASLQEPSWRIFYHLCSFITRYRRVVLVKKQTRHWEESGKDDPYANRTWIPKGLIHPVHLWWGGGGRWGKGGAVHSDLHIYCVGWMPWGLELWICRPLGLRVRSFKQIEFYKRNQPLNNINCLSPVKYQTVS